MVALLSQAGRLPLISPQRILGWAIGSAVEIALKWMKEGGQKASNQNGGEILELDPKQIPDEFELEATLDVSLPQDDLQAANVGNMLTEGEDPLVSQEWVLKEILKIEQPSEMRSQIWREKSSNLRFMQWMAFQLAKVQADMQQAMTPPVPPEMMEGAPPEGGAELPPEELPPEELPPEPEGPPVEGIPPGMAEGGQRPLVTPRGQAPIEPAGGM